MCWGEKEQSHCVCYHLPNTKRIKICLHNVSLLRYIIIILCMIPRVYSLTMPTEKMDVTILTAKTISSGGHLAHVYVSLPHIHKVVL